MDVLLRRRLVAGTDRWLVSEIDARSIPGARGERCLVCQTEQIVRRLWQYPAGWFTLSDAALGALCEGRLADVGRAEDRHEPTPIQVPRFDDSRRLVLP